MSDFATAMVYVAAFLAYVAVVAIAIHRTRSVDAPVASRPAHSPQPDVVLDPAEEAAQAARRASLAGELLSVSVLNLPADPLDDTFVQRLVRGRHTDCPVPIQAAHGRHRAMSPGTATIGRDLLGAHR